MIDVRIVGRSCKNEKGHDVQVFGQRFAKRFKASGKDRLILLVASDLDPDGDSIAKSFGRSIRDDFGIDEVVAVKALLTVQQVANWKLPRNEMAAKQSSGQYETYVRRYGSDAVFEHEAIEPALMQASIAETIESVIDIQAFNRELDQEKKDAVNLATIKRSVAEQLSQITFSD